MNLCTRVFRVVRLFHRFKSLNRIVTALGKALVPVSSAMMLLVVTTAAFSVLATSLFRDDLPTHFRDFSHSLFTMFQVATGEAWASTVVRPIFNARDPEEQTTDRSISTFFVTYVIIAGVILMNVVVAVLLDEFIECITEEKEHNAALKKAKDEQAFESMRVYGYMDPILRNMCRFTTQVHARICVHMRICMCVCMYVRMTCAGSPRRSTRVYVYTCVYVCVCICICLYARMTRAGSPRRYTRTYLRMYACMYVCLYA